MSIIKILDSDLPLKLEWLRSFLATVETGGYSAAARALRLSQPALWTHVRELEANLKVRLVENLRGRVRPTREGTAVAREARRVLDATRALRDAASDASGTVQGVLTVAASTTPGNYLMPRAMAEWEKRHPRARTALAVGNSKRTMARLEASEADLAVLGSAPSDRERFTSELLCDDHIVAFVASRHPLARRRRVAPSELAGRRLIVREAGSSTRGVADAWLARAALQPILLELGCPETVKRAVAAGLGIGILSRLALAEERARGEVAELKLEGFPITRGIHVVRLRRRAPSRAVDSFLEVMRAGRRR